MLDLLFLLFVLYLVLNSWSSRSSSSAPYRSPRTWSTPSLDPRTSTTPTLPLDPSCNPYEGPECQRRNDVGSPAILVQIGSVNVAFQLAFPHFRCCRDVVG